jgi:cellulose synthase/poly-beta-1,6-N-acetylglucosamine synthase-like glycosyltransferase
MMGLRKLAIYALYIAFFALVLALKNKLKGLGCSDGTSTVFSVLFLFRYYRLIIHILAWFFSRPLKASCKIIFSNKVTAVVPSVSPSGGEFEECLRSICSNSPAKVIVVVSDYAKLVEAQIIVQDIEYEYAVPFMVIDALVANKRKQLVAGLKHVNTGLVAFADDHVYWPADFLNAAIPPFKQPCVGLVGTTKRVRRRSTKTWWDGFWNVLGCLYLERHNFEILATNFIDGGVFVVSGRTLILRNRIVQDPEFLAKFLNERFFFNLFGPLNADDDNFITRWIVKKDFRIVIQQGSKCTIETDVGEYPKFLSQCLRWVRTTWRSNTASLITDRTIWRHQPWCTYAVYLSSLINFALFYDSAMIMSLWIAVREQLFVMKVKTMACLVLWILCSKLVKVYPYFLRNPQDLKYLPFYIIFGYYHSFIKLYAMFTFWVCAWGSRKGVE